MASAQGVAQSSLYSGPPGKPRSPKPCDIAIVGMGCLLPGARDVKTFWKNILNRVDAIREIPPERFDYNLYLDSDRKARDRIYSKWGGFLEEIEFDPMRYGIPPAALPSIDPLQLLAIEVVHQALEDAGYLKKNFPKETTAVILGISGGLGDLGLNYGVRSILPTYFGEVPAEIRQDLPEWTEDSFAGLLPNVAAGRVSNRFDLGGVNYTVDAACASSLAAVYLATRELESGASDVAVVGGVDTTQSPFGYLCFSSAQALSPKGRCRTFDASADGIVISEGVAVLVLKRLEDAERDSDRIYAVIKGVAGSSDGRGRSLTAPRTEGQVLALERAYAQAGISAATVGLIEAHGTGTVAGDAAEVASLCRVFESAGAAAGSCALGSVKSMIGHTKSAAGVTGLMKVALALYHRTLPPTLHVENPNQRLREPGTPFFINTEALPWIPPSQEIPRRAGISAFGFGGTNFHAVVEEYRGEVRDQAVGPAMSEWPGELFHWKAKSAADLDSSLQALENLAGASKPLLRDLARTVCAEAAAPEQHGERVSLSIVASSLEDLLAKTREARDVLRSGDAPAVSNPRGVYLAAGSAEVPKLALLFPGQGSQYPQMMRDLALYFPELDASLGGANTVLAGKLPRALSSYIYPTPSFSPAEKEEKMAALTDTSIAQPALGAVEMGLTRLLRSLGVRGDMAAGHSYGEYVALWAAGVLSDSDLVEISAARGRLIKESVGEVPGTMAAVRGSREEVADALGGLEGIWMANFNAPGQTIIAGREEDVERAGRKLAEKGLTSRPIPVACAFHTPLVAGAAEKLGELLSRLELAKPEMEVFSNTLAAPYPKEPGEIAALLREQLIRPVDFENEVRAMYESGARVFLEVGPKSVLTGLVRQILEGKNATCIPLDVGERHGVVQLLHALGQLAVLGYPIDLERLFQGRSARVLSPDHEEKQRPRSAWVVGGGRARPRTLAPKPMTPKSLSPPTAPAKAEAIPETSGYAMQPAPVSEHRIHTGIEELAKPANGSSRTMAVPGSRALPAENDAVMAQFQDVMRQFLEVQVSVMTAYLQGGDVQPVAFSPPVPRTQEIRAVEASFVQRHPDSQPVRRAEVATSVPAAPATPPAPAGRGQEAGTKQRDAAAELLAIVCARTGYPPDMLSLDVNIEADLGIDSIKRVEILTAFQKSCNTEEQARIHSVMDRLNSRKTLAEIAGILSEALGSSSRPQAASAGPPVAAEPAHERHVSAELLEIVGARTGYPPDMLRLDVNIEADLGIDSIKRVEILAAFQKACGAGEQARIQAVMDRLNSRKTLGEIAEILAEALASSPQPAAAVSTPAVPSSVPPRVSSEPARKRNVGAELLEITSARTGYPADMLGLDVNIEADLGIDSIKRVEILTAFQKAGTADEQARVQAVMDKLNSRKTLREIADLLSASLNGQQAVTTEKVAAVSKGANGTPANGKHANVPRFVMKAVGVPLAKVAVQIRADRLWLITDDESGIAEALAASLRRDGERAVLLRHCDRKKKSQGTTYFVDLTSHDEVEKTLERVRGEHGPIGAVVHLLPLKESPPFWEMDQASWHQRVQLEIKSLYALARYGQQDLVSRGRSGGARFCVVTAMGGAFATEPKPEISPIHAGVAGFLKTYSLELPEVISKAIDLDPSEPVVRLAETLRAELASEDETLEVGYRGDQRVTLVPTFTQLGPGPRGLLLERDSVVLLTGGARGITAEIAAFLAAQFQPALILAGLSPLPAEEPSATAGISDPRAVKAALLNGLGAGAKLKPAELEAKYQRLIRDREITRNLEKLRSAGARVEYHQIDVRDEAAMGSLLDGVYEKHGRLDLVVHGAGVIEDKLLRDKAPDSFDRVLHTKVDSAFALVRKLRPQGLKSLIFMSSVTATFGNRGQCDYAAANGVLNGLSALLSAHWPGRVVALNWGPWDKLGMVSPGVRAQFLERGIQLIPPDSGVMAAAQEIQAGSRSEPVVALGNGPWAEEAEQGVAGAVSRSLSSAVVAGD